MKFKLKNIFDYIKNLNEKQLDIDAVEKEHEDLIKSQSKCPRCGENENNCICIERDSSSTVNIFKYQKGKKYGKNNKDNKK